MNLDELAQHLRDAAGSVELRAGSVTVAKATGRRRRYRRRRIGVAAGAVATIGVTTVGLHQLTRPRPRVVDGTPAATVPATTAAIAGSELSFALTDPALVWRRIDPDSAAAVASQVIDGAYLAPSPALPGVMVSTGPAVAESAARHLWRSDDGITWTEVGPLPDGATAATSWNGGGRIYAVGTMPGAAGSTSDTVRVSISEDGGGSWQGVDLPADNPELASLPHVTHVTSQISGIAAASGTTMVLVNQRAGVDHPALLTQLGFDPERSGLDEAGVIEYGCNSEPTTTVVAASVETTILDQGCTGQDRTVPWADLGTVGEALRRSLVQTPRLFAAVDGSTFSEVALPGDSTFDTQLYAVSDAAVLAGKTSWDSPAHELWLTSDGSSWVPLVAPATGGSVQPLGSGLFSLGQHADGSASVAVNPDGSGWASGGLRQLYPDGEAPFSYLRPVATAHGVTMAVTVGNLETVESSEATTPVTAVEITSTRWELLHTADGIAWSRESVAELAGVADDEISSVSRIQLAADTVVAAVTLRAPEGEVGRQIVLVGTPAG